MPRTERRNAVGPAPEQRERCFSDYPITRFSFPDCHPLIGTISRPANGRDRHPTMIADAVSPHPILPIIPCDAFKTSTTQPFLKP
jgi:hypothetical protein